MPVIRARRGSWAMTANPTSAPRRARRATMAPLPVSPATPPPIRDAEEAQRAHYDRIIAAYEAHYGDATSQRYRRGFIYEPLLGDVDLAGKEILEAMCGSGQATARSEEHTSELQSLRHLVCRLLLEKKK